MDKYCIVPKTSRILFELARGMEMNHDEEELLKGGFIRHVEISLDTNTWEILAWTMPQIAESLLERVASFVEEKNQVAKVLIYQTAMKLDKIVEQNWEKLVDYVAKENQGVRHILLHSNRIYKESDESSTYTHVEKLSPDAKIEEVARLIGGETITDAAREAARELMK